MHVPEQVLFPKGPVQKLRRPRHCFKTCKVQAHGTCKVHAETGAHRSAKANATQSLLLIHQASSQTRCRNMAEQKMKDMRWTSASAALC